MGWLFKEGKNRAKNQGKKVKHANKILRKKLITWDTKVLAFFDIHITKRLQKYYKIVTNSIDFFRKILYP